MITLTAKDLQELLMIDRGISPDCFNLGVRFQADREYKAMKRYNSITKHHMDLRLCVSTSLYLIISCQITSIIYYSSNYEFYNKLILVILILTPDIIVF
jgi:hypothetical protein